MRLTRMEFGHLTGRVPRVRTRTLDIQEMPPIMVHSSMLRLGFEDGKGGCTMAGENG